MRMLRVSRTPESGCFWFFLSPDRLDEVQNVFVRGVSFRFSQAFFIQNIMVEPLLSGIVLGFIPVTIAGLFVTAYLQYRRGDQLTF